jgi:hypothetical protein
MAIFAILEDEEKGYQPMTCDAVEIDNRYRSGMSDVWGDQKFFRWKQAGGTANL